MRAYGSAKRHNRYTGDDRALVPDVRLARERRLNRLGENHLTQDDLDGPALAHQGLDARGSAGDHL